MLVLGKGCLFEFEALLSPSQLGFQSLHSISSLLVLGMIAVNDRLVEPIEPLFGCKHPAESSLQDRRGFIVAELVPLESSNELALGDAVGVKCTRDEALLSICRPLLLGTIFPLLVESYL